MKLSTGPASTQEATNLGGEQKAILGWHYGLLVMQMHGVVGGKLSMGQMTHTRRDSMRRYDCHVGSTVQMSSQTEVQMVIQIIRRFAGTSMDEATPRTVSRYTA